MTALWVLWAVYCLALAIDALYVQPWRRRKAFEASRSYESGALSFGLRAALPFFSIILLARTFLIDVYHIPSQSMRPLLDEGSRIWVNRLAYGLRWPLTGQVLVADRRPHRGDVVIFQYPREPETTYVKRVLGLPGDRVELFGDRILVNGEPVALMHSDSTTTTAKLGDVTYRLIMQPAMDPFQMTVPPDHYFTLGDNLADSQDSRVWGPLPHTNLLGRVIL